MHCRVFPHPSGQERTIQSSSQLSTVICLASVCPWCTAAAAVCYRTLTAAPPASGGMKSCSDDDHDRPKPTHKGLQQSHKRIRHAVLTITAPQRRTPPRHNAPIETSVDCPSRTICDPFQINTHDVLPSPSTYCKGATADDRTATLQDPRPRAIITNTSWVLHFTQQGLTICERCLLHKREPPSSILPPPASLQPHPNHLSPSSYCAGQDQFGCKKSRIGNL